MGVFPFILVLNPYFFVDVKAKKHLDPVHMELKGSVLNKMNDSISVRGDYVIRY